MKSQILSLLFIFYIKQSVSAPINPYQSGLIKDYNYHQQPQYKYSDSSVQQSNQHHFLPLTISKNDLDLSKKDENTIDQSLNRIKKFEENINKKFKNFNNSINSLEKSPSALLSELFARVTNRYINSNKIKQEFKSNRTAKKNFDLQKNEEICPESSYLKTDLDSSSKAYLAPILFHGKLASLSEDYSGRVAATFQVLKVIKSSSMNIKDKNGINHKVPIQIERGHQVVLHFVRKPGQRFIPPHCAVFMNSSSIGSMRLEQKYFVYAAPPVNSLQEMHRYSFGSVTYDAETKKENQTDKTELKNLVWFNEKHTPLIKKNTSLVQSTNLTSLTNNTKDEKQIPKQFIIHYLSAYSAPDPYSKSLSKTIQKTICKNCAKKPQVEGLNEDVRVQIKNKLRLKCKVSGNPQPWVEWYRNGKKLRNKGRVSLKNNKKIFKLEINRVESSDSGYYECRVMNVVDKQPVVFKTRVIVVLPQTKKIKPNIDNQTKPSTKIYTSTAANLWPLIGQPCPINNFCLNGGVCTFFENVFEYVCQCADGYQGQRCESKEIYILKKNEICAPGYRGLRCEEKDIFSDEPIKNKLEFNSILKQQANTNI